MNIIDLKDGEQVPGDGVFRCSMHHYHSQDICPGPSVSSTGIRQAVVSPHEFWVNSELNEDRYPEKEQSDSLILGRAAHALILEDRATFDEQFIFLPDNAPPRPTAAQQAAYERDGKWSESAAPRAKFWAKWDAEAAGRELLTSAQMEKITYMAQNLARCPEAAVALSGDLVEISMIWEDPMTGLWLKSRPDNIPSQRFDFGDLKTFAPKSKNLAFAALRSTLDYDYPMQMALACMGAEHIWGVEMNQACMLVFIQTTAPYEPVPVEISQEAIGFAKLRIRKGIDAIARGLETGEWPFATQTIPTFTYPEKMIEEFEG